MKLRDFGDKRPIRKPSGPQFTLTNNAAEESLKKEVEDLRKQTEFLVNIQQERDDAMRRMHVAEDHLQTERVEFAEALEKIQKLEKEVEYQNEQLETIPTLEEKVRNVKGEESNYRNQIDILQKQLASQHKDFSLISKKLESLQSEQEDLKNLSSQAVSHKNSAVAEFNSVKTKNEKLESFADETSKINKELFEENKSLKDQVTYWSIESQELQVQLEEIKTLEGKLRSWISGLEKQESQTTTSKNAVMKKVDEQQKIITDMSNTLDDMMKELSYTRQLNKAYREELSKPTYTSMAAIASQEGFVMPNGKANVRTHNLGNYKPTLLKFKKQEANNGG
jgi:chromosome segregation ATPase